MQKNFNIENLERKSRKNLGNKVLMDLFIEHSNTTFNKKNFDVYILFTWELHVKIIGKSINKDFYTKNFDKKLQRTYYKL